MKLAVKLIDNTLAMPQYQTEGSIGFDLYSRIDMEILPKKITIIPLNVVIKVPKGYMLLLAARSSLPLKKNLIIANGIGVIDQDYHGDSDEIGLEVLNITDQSVKITKGERIAQALLVKIDRASEFTVVTRMTGRSRHGFGSTGTI